MFLAGSQVKAPVSTHHGGGGREPLCRWCLKVDLMRILTLTWSSASHLPAMKQRWFLRCCSLGKVEHGRRGKQGELFPRVHGRAGCAPLKHLSKERCAASESELVSSSDSSADSPLCGATPLWRPPSCVWPSAFSSLRRCACEPPRSWSGGGASQLRCHHVESSAAGHGVRPGCRVHRVLRWPGQVDRVVL